MFRAGVIDGFVAGSIFVVVSRDVVSEMNVARTVGDQQSCVFREDGGRAGLISDVTEGTGGLEIFARFFFKTLCSR